MRAPVRTELLTDTVSRMSSDISMMPNDEQHEQGRHEGSLDRNRALLVARSTSVAAHDHSVP